MVSCLTCLKKIDKGFKREIGKDFAGFPICDSCSEHNKDTKNLSNLEIMELEE